MLDNPMLAWQDKQNENTKNVYNSAEYADFLIDMYADDLEDFCTEENQCGSCLCRGVQ